MKKISRKISWKRTTLSPKKKYHLSLLNFTLFTLNSSDTSSANLLEKFKESSTQFDTTSIEPPNKSKANWNNFFLAIWKKKKNLFHLSFPHIVFKIYWTRVMMQVRRDDINEQVEKEGFSLNERGFAKMKGSRPSIRIWNICYHTVCVIFNVLGYNKLCACYCCANA